MKIRAGKISLNKDAVPKHFLSSPTGGFTLTEVITVAVVISLMASIAIPTYRKWLPNMQLKSAAQDLRANMQGARFDAIKENAPWALIFDTANGQYHICSDDGVDNDWTALSDNTCEVTVDFNTYNQGIHFGKGSATVNATTSGGAFPADGSFVSYAGGGPIKTLIFTTKGTCNAGYVYLTHKENTTSYALGTLVSGVVRVKKWVGTGWD